MTRGSVRVGSVVFAVFGTAVGKCSVVFVSVRECSGRFSRASGLVWAGSLAAPG